ncbi:hypothetical protein [Deinococcus malanensis]|uniref:hypothetical protein n=1 Tax=Deinococcus malanensis TaxID=1706855 RepID=UPI00166CDF56|nr:hypothetical protein [Deinococcus malanensis]
MNSGPPPSQSFQDLRTAVAAHDYAAATVLLEVLTPAYRQQAAPLALQLGQPRLAAAWTDQPLLQVAALLRLGEPAAALEVLREQGQSARPAALRARAVWQLQQQDARSLAEEARRRAQAEGDAAALVAVATLRGEQCLEDPFAALRALAEGLKIAELTGDPADAHLLAVLGHAQLRMGSGKGRRTAEKALERSLPASPARVLALLALDQPEEAMAQASSGELAAVWWRGFITSGSASGSEMGHTVVDG